MQKDPTVPLLDHDQGVVHAIQTHSPSNRRRQCNPPPFI
jgi:hypothetical protein